jgi:hypothetical protein
VLLSALLATSLFSLPTSAALSTGQRCTLQTPVSVLMNSAGGRVELTLEKGVAIVVEESGEVRTAISAGSTSGTVSTADLVAACAPPAVKCKLRASLTMYEQTRSDSKAWHLKPGSVVAVLRSGKVWSQLQVAELEGFSLQEDVKAVCVAIVERPVEVEEVAPIERGDGPGVVYQPFLIDGSIPVGEVDAVGELLFERLSVYRPDAARLPAAGSRAAVKWKAHADAAAAKARSAGVAYAVIGQASRDPDGGPTSLIVNLVVVDAQTKKVLKGIKVRPTKKPTDPWLDNALAVLLPHLASAPGARPPPTMRGESSSSEMTPLR